MFFLFTVLVALRLELFCHVSKLAIKLSEHSLLLHGLIDLQGKKVS
jgi:hypothetical protein